VGVFFGTVTGIGDASNLENGVATLSPNAPHTATNLCVRLSAAPGAGVTLTFRLRVNLADTPVVCSITGAALTANSGTASASIPAGSLLAIEIESTGVHNANSAYFGWELR
jgi:hypothetical protein